jgi:hypothetical protein
MQRRTVIIADDQPLSWQGSTIYSLDFCTVLEEIKDGPTLVAAR